MRHYCILIAVLCHFGLFAQVDNTMYGLYQSSNSPGFRLASLDPLTGQLTTIGTTSLCNAVNVTGAALNPYNQTYSFQDQDSWLTVDLQTGTVLNDVVATLPNANGNFDNFRFNTADSNMYGLYRQIISDPITGAGFADMRLATCDLTTGLVSVISPSSIAQSYTLSGCTIDPYLMVYYFESEGKFMGLDLYNGEIYSQPTISIAGAGSNFGNFAYSCADTSVYGLIMNTGVNALGKINPQTGVVTPLPTALNFDNYILNSGGAIDPINLVYYFQTWDATNQIKIVGLSLIDGSVASQSYMDSSNFTMYRIQSDCYEADPSRLNPMSTLPEINASGVSLYPNPAQDFLNVTSESSIQHVDILTACGTLVDRIETNATKVQIPIESLAKGLYYLRVCSNEVEKIERFIKD